MHRTILVTFGLSVGVLLAASGCDDDSSPTGPTVAESSMTLTVNAPQAGSTVVLPSSYTFFVPGGVVVPKDSGHLSITIEMTSAHYLPWAQLNVYLLTEGTTTEYCGQNTPDSPTWGFLPEGWNTTLTITGFRVYRLPCQVTGIRAMLHTRNNGNLTPPSSAETVVEAKVDRTFTIVQ